MSEDRGDDAPKEVADWVVERRGDNRPATPDVGPNPFALLNGKQHIALMLLTEGFDQKAAAKGAAVSRATVNRWCTNNPTFQAALAQYRAGLLAEHAIAISRVDKVALEVIEAAMLKAPAEKAGELAMKWLTLRKLCACGTAPGQPHHELQNAT